MTVNAATVTGPHPDAPGSRAVVLEPYGTDRMARYDYVQEEYFVSGVAAGSPYGTRILLRRPADLSRFSGTVISEPSHIWGGTSVWRAINRFIMRENHIWVEIDSQAPSAMGLIAAAAPDRYRSFTFADSPLSEQFAATIPFSPDPDYAAVVEEYDRFMQRWWDATPQSPEILAQVAATLRSGLPGTGITARKVYIGGISQTGGAVREFIRHHHTRLRLPGGAPAFDGYLPGASGGPALPDIDVPVVEVLGEAEFQSVRRRCGVGGQVRGLNHRRPDSSTFRLYEVAGMAHRETRHMSAADRDRLAQCPLPAGARWSTFPNSHVYHALWQALLDWSDIGLAPVPSKLLSTVDETDEILRDAHGNALGGLRTTYVDAPASTLTAATPLGRPSWYHGNETPFPPTKFEELYGGIERWQRRVADHLEHYLQERTYLPVDAEEIRETATPRTV
ncbi:alpha/beta hydrolase domain-containing protein [Lentzea sp. E54]|uniref:alpha/beta hydrolase domain-containing protein n=1 Tax=Lentzea xerophila TaxID=3435883 RepID=UPI003DA25CA1